MAENVLGSAILELSTRDTGLSQGISQAKRQAESLNQLFGQVGRGSFTGLQTGFNTALESMRQGAAKNLGEINRTMQRFGTESRVVADLSGILGKSFDANAEKARLLRSTMTDLLRSGLSPAAPQVKKLATEFQALQRQSISTSSSLLALVRGPLPQLASALTAAFAVQQIVGFGRSVLQTGIEFERLGARFAAVAGSATGAQAQLAFVRTEADRLGLSFQVLAAGFSGIAAAAQTTSLGLEGARALFIAVSEASAAFGLSNQDTQGILLAFQQILSKGTVAAEELRGQIGERLPGAFQIAAKAMGVTTEELNKLLVQGRPRG